MWCVASELLMRIENRNTRRIHLVGTQKHFYVHVGIEEW